MGTCSETICKHRIIFPSIQQIFTVSEVRYTDPITYKLKDLNGEEIKGSFYEQELQKTTQEMFRIEKVIRRQISSQMDGLSSRV